MQITLVISHPSSSSSLCTYTVSSFVPLSIFSPADKTSGVSEGTLIQHYFKGASLSISVIMNRKSNLVNLCLSNPLIGFLHQSGAEKHRFLQRADVGRCGRGRRAPLGRCGQCLRQAAHVQRAGGRRQLGVVRRGRHQPRRGCGCRFGVATFSRRTTLAAQLRRVRRVRRRRRRRPR